MAMIINKLRATYSKIFYNEFYSIKRKVNGMLSVRNYSKIYGLVTKLPNLDIVEIGGASGAGSIIIAKAIKDSNKKSKLIVVEKCRGGSRDEVGDYDSNLNLIRNNFRMYDLEDQIILHPQEITIENGSEVIKKIQTEKIAALIHDADGHLERDFLLFWPLLIDNGLIIVDDYSEKTVFTKVSTRHPQGGIKSLMTYRLLNQLIEWGLFKVDTQIGDTIYGTKPVNADFSKLDMQKCQKIINQVKEEHRRYITHN